MHGPDDLGDDFLPDETVVLSGDEQLVIEDPIGRSDTEESTEQVTVAANIAKKRKRREKEKARKAKKQKLLESSGDVAVKSIAGGHPHELAVYLATLQAKAFPKFSMIELHDIEVPESSIADTTAWTGPRTLDQLVPFIMKMVPTLHTLLDQRSKSNGAPTLIYIAGAALRVADVTRVLRDKKLRGDKGGEVAKLFAKHFKLSEHVTYLKRTKVGAAVGTPGRMGKLLCETDALSAVALTHIILDVSYVDAKKRTLLDIPETRDEVFRTVLGAPPIIKAIKSGQVQVVLF